MSPFYVIDTEAMTGQGPFESKEEAATAVADNVVSSESVIVSIGESGEIEFVDSLDSLDEDAPTSN